jgi:hypothetical protein
MVGIGCCMSGESWCHECVPDSPEPAPEKRRGDGELVELVELGHGVLGAHQENAAELPKDESPAPVGNAAELPQPASAQPAGSSS